MSSSAPQETMADLVVSAVRTVEGVAGMSGGPFDDVATLLPNRRVAGVRIFDDKVEIHISVDWGASVEDVGKEVRRTVQSVADRPVDVVVEDVAIPLSLES